MPRVTRYTRPKSEPPESLLHFLLRRFPYLTEAQWCDHITSGHLRVNGDVCCGADRTLGQGDAVLFQPPRTLEPYVDEVHIDIVHEDETILVCVKNGELPVTEGGRYCENTLMGVLKRCGTSPFTSPAHHSQLDSATATCSPASKRPRVEDTTHSEGVAHASLEGPDARLSFFPIHRLDKETSGLLVMGKTLQAAQTLSQQFEHQSTTVLAALGPLLGGSDGTATLTESERCAIFANLTATHKLVAKTYRAVVAGALPAGTVRVVTQRIGKQCEDPDLAAHPAHQKLKKLKMACFSPFGLLGETTPQANASAETTARARGKPAVSRITWLRSDPTARLSVVEVSLLTGRTHQIRLHCAHLGFPIVGDKLYACRVLGEEGGSLAVEDDVYMDRARRSETEMLPAAYHPDLLCKRHLLHAAQLGFQHPVSGAVVDVVSPAASWFLRDVESRDGSLKRALSALLDGL